MNKFKLAFAVLSIASIAWGIVFIVDFLECAKYIEERSTDGSILGNLIFYPLFYLGAWSSGRYVVLSGALLAVAWVAFIKTTILGEILSAFVDAVRRAFQNK